MIQGHSTADNWSIDIMAFPSRALYYFMYYLIHSDVDELRALQDVIMLQSSMPYDFTTLPLHSIPFFHKPIRFV